MSSAAEDFQNRGSTEIWKSLVDSNDLDEEDVKKFYVSWAETYDRDLSVLKCQSFIRLTEKVCKYFPDRSARERVKVLDVAAGTGNVGVEMNKAGFKNLDAVDMSQAMLDKLKVKNIYNKAICSLVGGGNKINSVEDNTYDVVMISGGFAVAHMPVNALREVVRVLKSGGYFFNSMTEYYLESVEALHELEPLMKSMEDEGLWTRLERQTVANNISDKTGLFHVYRKN